MTARKTGNVRILFAVLGTVLATGCDPDLGIRSAGDQRVGTPTSLQLTANKVAVPGAGTFTIKDDSWELSNPTWTSSKDGHLGQGMRIDVAKLSPGNHRIKAELTVDGDWKSAEINLEIRNSAPKPVIDRGASTLRFGVKESGLLVGSAKDPDPVSGPSDIPDDRLEWHSSKDGLLGTGGRLTIQGLSGGKHTIELRAKDEYGQVGKTSVTVEVVNKLPEVEIVAPAFNTFFGVRDRIELKATARDEEDGGAIPDDKIVWTSDKDGEIGKGAETWITRLSPGKHQITCSATDSHKGVGKASVAVLIQNELPTAKIRRPYADWEFDHDDVIELRAQAKDKEDGEITRDNAFVWTLPDGSQRVGREVDLPAGTIKAGPHALTLQVTDSDGGQSEVMAVEIKVEAAPAPAGAPTVTAAENPMPAGSNPPVGETVMPAGSNPPLGAQSAPAPNRSPGALGALESATR